MKADPTLDRAAEFLARRGVENVPVACILGSGLGGFAEVLSDADFVDAGTIPGYPLQTVPGHRGRIVRGKVGDREILLVQGRSHLYESGDLAAVLFPVRLMYSVGVRTIILTNAAGGITPGLEPGDLMVISDQLNMTFQAMRQVPPIPGARVGLAYSPLYRAMLAQAALAADIQLRSGVYAGMLGPSYETAAEIRMLRRLGADAVGMSTVWEASCAAALGMTIAGISCITNMGTGLSASKLSHDEVTDVGRQVGEKFERLLTGFLHVAGGFKVPEETPE